MSIGSIPVPNDPPNYGKFKIKVGGNFVSNTPRYINLGSGIVVTEDELNDRLDITVPSVLGPGVITNSMIQAAAGIDWSKISKTGSLINDLGDVVIATPVTNQALTYNGTNWVNTTLAIPPTVDLTPYQAFKSIEMTGTVQGNNTAVATMGEGLLAPPVLEDTPTAAIDNNGGAHISFKTGTTEENLTGFKSNRAIALREVNPEFFCKIATPSITAMKMFIGFSENASQNNIDPCSLDNVDGFGLIIHTTDSATLYRIARNNGDATDTATNATTTIKTTPISVWMKLYNTLAKIDYAIWTASDGDPSLAAPTETGSVTTDIPTANQDLYYHCLITNFTTTDKTLDHWISKVRVTGENV